MLAVIEELGRVKQYRETEALGEVRRHRQLAEQATRLAEQRRAEAERFRAWRSLEEDRLYRDACTRLLGVTDLEDLKADIFGLRQRQRALEEQAEAADAERIKTVAALDQAQAAHAAARRQVEKYQELARIFRDEAKREAAYREDLEMEEFTVRTMGSVHAG